MLETICDDQHDAPHLVGKAETTFDSVAAPIEFFLDSHGAVTHFTLTGNDGEGTYDRKF
jgi:hypothetical protein